MFWFVIYASSNFFAGKANNVLLKAFLIEVHIIIWIETRKDLCLFGYEATMLSSVAGGKLWATGDPRVYLQAKLGFSQVNTKGGILHSLNSSENHYVHKLHAFSRCMNHSSALRSHHLWRDFKQESARSLLVCYPLLAYVNYL